MPSAYVNGINIHYEYQGSGLPVVFSHSFTSDCTMWTQQTSVITQRYQFITYDIRGMGCTDSPPGEYSLDQHAEDLYQLVRHLGLTEFVLGGLSIGGMITVHFALAHQELLKGIILADSAAARPEVPHLVNPEEVIQNAQSRGMAGLAEHMVRNRLLAPVLRKNGIRPYLSRIERGAHIDGLRVSRAIHPGHSRAKRSQSVRMIVVSSSR